MEPMQSSMPPETGITKNYLKENKKLVIVFIVLLLILCGLLTYIFLTNNTQQPIVVPNTPNNNLTPTPVVSTPSTSTTPTPAGTPTPVASALPEGWTMKESAFCQVSLPIPPNAAPYIEPVPAAGLTKVWETVLDQSHSADPLSLIFTGYIREILRFEGGVNGSDAPTPGVSVFCLPNAGSDEGPGILAMVDTKAKALGGSAVVQSTETLWGMQVTKILLNAGATYNETGYLFVKNNVGYYVTKESYPYTSPYNDYAQIIFDNIQFN